MKQLKILKVALISVIVGLIITIWVTNESQEQIPINESKDTVVLLAKYDKENKLTNIWSDYLAIDRLHNNEETEDEEDAVYKWFTFNEKTGLITPLRVFE